MREIITLQCNDCKNRNYTTTKNRKKHQDRLETSKFCNTCRKHTGHKEGKKARPVLGCAVLGSARNWNQVERLPLADARRCRGVGLTVDHRSPKPRVGVRIPPPLPD